MGSTVSCWSVECGVQGRGFTVWIGRPVEQAFEAALEYLQASTYLVWIYAHMSTATGLNRYTLTFSLHTHIGSNRWMCIYIYTHTRLCMSPYTFVIYMSVYFCIRPRIDYPYSWKCTATSSYMKNLEGPSYLPQLATSARR